MTLADVEPWAGVDEAVFIASDGSFGVLRFDIGDPMLCR